MPYRNAPFAMLAVIAVILAGFWPSYFSIWGTVPWQFHAHGIAASLWVLMLLFQSWVVRKDQLSLHRAVGKSSLILFPFLIGGLAAIIDVTAKGFVAGDPARSRFGAAFLVGLLLAVAAYVLLYHRALARRRRVWDHAGYMLATPLILFESPFSRVLGEVVPALRIEGPQHFDRLIPSIELGLASELAIIAILWWRLGNVRARPFLVAAGFIVAQMLTMGLMGGNSALEAMLAVIGRLPSAAVVLAGMTIGAVTSWSGWRAGKRPAADGRARPATA